MSILEAYEPDGEPIIAPSNFYCKRKKVADVAVVCFSHKAKRHVLASCKHELYLKIDMTANGEIEIHYLPEYGVLFFMSPIGASSAGGLLHNVAYIASVTKFVYFGSCGVLDPALKGKYIVPTSCYREEGFSYHFAPPSDYIDIKNHDTVASFLRGMNLAVAIGKGWTTDAFYNETKRKFEKLRKEGVLSVDMESSGLQAIADHIGVDFYTFYFAGDILGESWEEGDLCGENERLRQIDAVRVALELGKTLAR